MKIYTRQQVETMVKESYGNPRYRNSYNNLKTWCSKHQLYYEGVVRFFKGSDITLNTYSKILNAVDGKNNKVLTSSLSMQITFNDVPKLKEFMNEIGVIKQSQ